MRVSPTGRRVVGFAIGGLVAGLVLTGCTSAPEESATPAAPAVTSAAPAPSASSSASSSSAKATPSPAPAETPEPEPSAAEETGPEEVAIGITIADGRVDPNGKKLDVEVGQPIVLYVTSDEDDEVHAHTSEDGYTLEVKAGTKVRGEFILTSPGSYEVESHHLSKTIVILNAR